MISPSCSATCSTTPASGAAAGCGSARGSTNAPARASGCASPSRMTGRESRRRTGRACWSAACAPTSNVPGHGLGLAMVRETVDLYGGRLEIDASPLGGARCHCGYPADRGDHHVRDSGPPRSRPWRLRVRRPCRTRSRTPNALVRPYGSMSNSMPWASGSVAAPVDGVGLAAHVGLPGIRAGLAAAAGVLLAAEGAADLGARGAEVDVGDAAVAAGGRQERFRVLQPVGEQRRRQAVRRGVLQRRSPRRANRPGSGTGSARRSRSARSASRCARARSPARRSCPAACSTLPPHEQLRRPRRCASAIARLVTLDGRCVDQRAHQRARARAGRRCAPGGRRGAGAARAPRRSRSCTSTRRVVVQRWPAVPTAPNTIARHGQVEVGGLIDDDGVVAAELEQALAQPRGDALADLAADRGGAGEGDQRDARDRRRSAWRARVPASMNSWKTGGSAAALAAPGCTAAAPRARSAGSWARASTRRRCRRSRPSSAFQAHTATGKLKAEMMPTTPSGCHCSYMRCCGRSECMVRP